MVRCLQQHIDRSLTVVHPLKHDYNVEVYNSCIVGVAESLGGRGGSVTAADVDPNGV